MDPFKQREALRAEAKALRETLAKDNRPMTDDEATRVTAMSAELAEVEAKCAAIETATNQLKAFTAAEGERQEKDGLPAESGVGIGDAFTGSAGYKAWAEQHPSGVGGGSPIEIKAGRVGTLARLGRKADLITSPIAHLAPARYPTINLAYQDEPTFLDLITRGTAAGAFEYLQIVSATNNAAVVPEATSAGVIGDGTGGTVTAAAGGLKPTSDFETDLADAKPYTYADGYEATNSMLKDADALASWLNVRLGRNLELVVEDVLLNGTGTGGLPKGLFHTTGVLQQDYATDLPTTVRKAITRLQKVPGFARITGVVVNPDDDEAWDLLKDGNERYLGAGPFAIGPKTAWGYPRIVSTKVPVGTAVIGDLSTIALFDVEGISVLAFNQHKDFAQRNLTYVRAELRAEQAIFEPARLCIADTAGH
jgi:HK97 family phage major capsid protein